MFFEGHKSFRGLCSSALLAVVIVLGLCRAEAQANIVLGNAANYGVIVSPGVTGHSAEFNNGSFVGNWGIASNSPYTVSPLFKETSGSITGNIDFAGPINFTKTGGTFFGSVTGNVSAVTSAWNTIVSLSGNLALESGTSLSANPTTIIASAGILDLDGNRVFTVTGDFNPSGDLTINGSASDYVVVNITGDARFQHNVILNGGISDDHVVFNVLGSGSLQTGGAGNVVHGDIIAINETINMNNVTIYGRVFGGDDSDFHMVSGFNLNAPMNGNNLENPVPEPVSCALFGMSVLGGLAAWRRRK